MSAGQATSLGMGFSLAAVLSLALSFPSAATAQAKTPPKPEVVDMGSYRVSAPPGEGWTAFTDQDSGSVRFKKRWGGLLRVVISEQRIIEVTMALKQVPPGQWLWTEDKLAERAAGQRAGQEQFAGLEARKEVAVHGGKKLYYMRFEESVAGEASAHGVHSLDEDAPIDITSLYCLYFPPDIRKTHRYFEFFTTFTRLSNFLGAQNAGVHALHAVVDSLEIVDSATVPPGPAGDLVQAVAAGDLDAAAKALEDGAAIEEGDSGGSPLLQALSGQEPELAAFLIERGAGVNARLADGLSALMLASALGYQGIVTVMVDRGADIEARSDLGETSLMFACQSGSFETVSVLLEAGAGLDVQAADGGTALLRAIDAGRNGIARLLVGRGAEVNIRDSEGWTSLFGAIGTGDSGLVDMLIAKGAEVNAAPSVTGQTALLEALWAGQVAIAEALIAAGADVNGRRPEDWTPLMVAAANGQEVLVALLIEKGADVNARSGDKKTALKVAKKNKQDRIVRMLERAGAKK
jgi:ankyrin repeat protein